MNEYVIGQTKRDEIKMDKEREVNIQIQRAVDMNSRSRLLLGDEGILRLNGASILVFGVGGVGSHCIEALGRSGVGHITIVDNDTVALTNINRQAVALHSTIGRYKTDVMRERLLDINPSVDVRCVSCFVLPDNVEMFFDRAYDYVIDAVDTVAAKLAVIETAVSRNIPIISCMGVGNKLYADMLQITDLGKTSMCPLCKVMRRELKQRGIRHLKVLYSPEKPANTTGMDTGEDKGRRRALPGSVSFVPPVAGLLIAGEVIRQLSEVKKERC